MPASEAAPPPVKCKTCKVDLAFVPDGTKSSGKVVCPTNEDHESTPVITCHSCFRNHEQYDENWGVWLPNEKCRCVCHSLGA